MFGSHNSMLTQHYRQRTDDFTIPEIALVDSTLPNRAPHEPETARVLTYCVHINKSQLDLLATPLYKYTCTKFLEQLSRGEIRLDQVFHLLSRQEETRSPGGEWSYWESVAGASNDSPYRTSHHTSSQSNIPAAHQVWQAPISSFSSNHKIQSIHAPRPHHPSNPLNDDTAFLSTDAVSRNTPSTPSHDNDCHSNTFLFDDSLCIPDGMQPHGISGSIACHPPYPAQRSERASDFLSSPEARRRPSLASSQISDTPSHLYTPYNRWINNDAARMKTDKKNKKAPKTPCPKCPDKAFENRAEFVKHMTSVHEKPVEYICNHYLPGRQGDQYFCSESKWHFSSWAKHHTQHHSDICGVKQLQHNHSPSCRQEIINDRPVRQRGCWLCNHLSFTADQWVDHHLSKHRGSPRKAMSQTWAMKSLLSHSDITYEWQVQIKTLEITTGYFWDHKWPNDLEDAVILELIKSLETGYFRNKNFHEDVHIRAQLAKAVMDATANTRERLGAISSQKMETIRAELHKFRQYLAVKARSAVDLTDETKQLKRAASTTPLAGYGRRNQVEPWLRSQHDLANAPSTPLQLNLAEFLLPLLDGDD